MNSSILVSGLILGLFAILGTSIVGVTHDVTFSKIADNERLATLRRLNQILPHNHYDNDLLNTTITIAADDRLGQRAPSTVYIAKQQTQVSAMIFSVIAPRGYSGEIKMLIGVNMDGRVAGVRIVSHKETPGLGDAMEIERSDWVLSFNTRSLLNPDEKYWKVKRDGGYFDQFTGATITPRAVVQAVHLCLVYFDRHKQELVDQYRQTQQKTVPERTVSERVLPQKQSENSTDKTEATTDEENNSKNMSSRK
ncbi:Electron transport complex protein RnfG [hydrothermal vent metagenome]|uniref:Electron transport complex protein RnfG n=1 Tax=hydrothermal vent metagenome TaxID=652676 RepID=A0A3B0X958_9ZZZZ